MSSPTEGIVDLSESDQAALAAIRATYEELDRWRARGRSIEEPERGSDLHRDAQIWPWHPPFEVARQSLIAGTQHLNLARTAVEARDLYPTAHYTVLRGALVGAAQAVWLLEPDSRVERQQRALRVIEEWYFRRLQYNNAVGQAELSERNRSLLTDQTRHIQARKATARQRWTATETLSESEKLDMTKVISATASQVFRDLRTVRAVEILWRLMSGDAHGLGWQLATRAQSWTPNDGGLAIAVAGGDLLDLAQPFTASFRLLRRGWSLFDRRAEAVGGRP